MFEGTNIEFKELDRKTGKLPETMMREVVAFLNTDGGDIFIGIRNDRSIVGVKDPDDVITKLSSAIGDSILPNPLPFIRFDRAVINLRKYKSLFVDTMRVWYYFSAFAFIGKKEYENALADIEAGLSECEKDKLSGNMDEKLYQSEIKDFEQLRKRCKI